MLKKLLKISVLILLLCSYSCTMYTGVTTYRGNEVTSRYRYRSSKGDNIKGKYNTTSSAKTNIDRMIHSSRLSTNNLINIKNKIK